MADRVTDTVRPGATVAHLRTAVVEGWDGAQPPWPLGLYVAHGVGFSGVEPPFAGTDLGIDAERAMPVVESQVLMVEPYVFHDGVGGYRAERRALVTALRSARCGPTCRSAHGAAVRLTDTARPASGARAPRVPGASATQPWCGRQRAALVGCGQPPATRSTAAPRTRSCARSRSASACSSGYGVTDPNADRGRDGEELLAVAAGVGRDAAELPLLKQVVGVAQRRDVAQVDARDGERAAAVERRERGRDDLACRSEDDRGIERLGWRVERVRR